LNTGTSLFTSVRFAVGSQLRKEV